MRAVASLLAALALASCASQPPVAPETLGALLRDDDAELAWWVEDEGRWRRVDDGAVGLEEVAVARSPDGGARIDGVLTRPPGARDDRALVLAVSADAPARALGRHDLEARIDPLPLTERTRLPFHIAVAPGGIPLDGQARVALFGVITSEDGPTALVLLRLTF